MQLYPTVVAEAEAAYRRERIAEDFRRTGGRSHRPRRGTAERRLWHRREDRSAA